MALFWEFFTFELKFRFKSLSTYVYFALWLRFPSSPWRRRISVPSATAMARSC